VQANANRRPERGAFRERIGLDGCVHRHGLRTFHDELAFGEHRTLKPLDVIKRSARDRRYVFRGHSRPDIGLDFTRRKSLADTRIGSHLTEFQLQCVVDRQAITVALVVGDDQRPAFRCDYA
jgi:hypothetical protein